MNKNSILKQLLEIYSVLTKPQFNATRILYWNSKARKKNYADIIYYAFKKAFKNKTHKHYSDRKWPI